MALPRILFFDIESSNLNANFGTILSIGWKWWGVDEVKVKSLLDYPAVFRRDPTNDCKLVDYFKQVYDTADVTVGWYSSRFDLPMISSKLVEFQRAPLAPVQHIDLWRTAKYQLKLSSNRLGSVAEFLGIEEKTPVKGLIWRKACAGHKDSIGYVIEHNRQDVVVLEQAYGRLLPWIVGHPNLNLVLDSSANCPKCGKATLTKQGSRQSLTRQYQRFQCQSCGSWCRSRKSEPNKLEVV